MIQEKKSKRGTLIALGCAAVFLLLVLLLENLVNLIPAQSLPTLFRPTSMLFVVLKKGAVYALVAVSMNLLNGFTGLFSLGQAGFMLLGAYTYAILTVPTSAKDSVYYLFDGSAVKFSLQEVVGKLFGNSGVGGAVSLILGVLLAMILAGCVAALFAWLIGLPVLRLKSDYLAIATLGFAEILRAIFQWDKLGPITNGANMLKNFPTYSSFNVKGGNGQVMLHLSTFFPLLIAILCIGVIVMLINSTYGRAFKAIRDDEIAAEAMGINLARHKMLSFVISSFFAGVGGALFAMYVNNAQAMVYTSTMTYEILLIVVIGGIGSISGSVLATFLYVACSEWWLRFLDTPKVLTNANVKLQFVIIFAIVVAAVTVLIFWRQSRKGQKLITTSQAGDGKKSLNLPLLLLLIVAVALLAWDVWFALNPVMQLPLLRNGFRMVVFSVVIMIVVLFFRKGIMGDKEFTDLFRRRAAAVPAVPETSQEKGDSQHE